MIIYVGAVTVAVSLGFSGAALVEHLSGAEPDPCKELCSYAEIPQVAANANLQSQLRDHECRCAPRANAPSLRDRPPPPPLPGALPAYPEPEEPAAPKPASP